MAYDYNELYSQQEHALGEPFDEVVAYFNSIPAPKRVLDLGAGQGRDTIFIAKLGHHVHAVDLSSAGLEQLARDALNYSVTTEKADLERYEPSGVFDIILIDRTLHMLGVDAGNQTLNRIVPHVIQGGEIYILDEKSNIPKFADHLVKLGLDVTSKSKSSLIAKK